MVNFGIQSVSNDSKLYGVEAIVSDSFNICEKYLPHDMNLQDYEHLADIKLPDVEIKEISILIGKDVDEVHDIYEFRKSPNPEKPLHGILGPLGWVITGSYGEPVMNKEINVNYIDSNHDYDLNDMVKKFWKMEDSGINKSNVSDKSLSIEDKRAIDIMEKTTVLSGGHYETGLLWKNNNGKLPNNNLKPNID
ncbi:hypothetical protein SNE40_021970 [Patella caerulea]|uniref:Uncharacterized protein n=1 Tax=Patella caerulea TaxID=87958 RepID=A0AAN8GD27_PATCE